MPNSSKGQPSKCHLLVYDLQCIFREVRILRSFNWLWGPPQCHRWGSLVTDEAGNPNPILTLGLVKRMTKQMLTFPECSLQARHRAKHSACTGRVNLRAIQWGGYCYRNSLLSDWKPPVDSYFIQSESSDKKCMNCMSLPKNYFTKFFWEIWKSRNYANLLCNVVIKE